MIKTNIIGCGVVTPLGNTPGDVFDALQAGRTAVREHPAGTLGLKEPFCASLFEGPREDLFCSIAVEAGEKALAEAGGLTPGTALVLCSVKGEIGSLREGEDVSLAASARKIAERLGIQGMPVVVSDACISGLSGIVQARRMLLGGLWDRVLVIGAEVQSRFIVAGFNSLKALSEQPCRPFDASRSGLNPGEAAAALVLSLEDSPWEVVHGAIRNDANHISGPSRTAEGSFNALSAVLPYMQGRPAFVGVHGTGTLYNDQMEAIALERAGLLDIPVSALKGYFGHTMGAAGILETIIGMQSLLQGRIPGSRGFAKAGTEPSVNISADAMECSGNEFLKLLSGFGGINGALLIRHCV